MRFIQGIVRRGRFTQGYVAPIIAPFIPNGIAGQPIGLLLTLTKAS